MVSNINIAENLEKIKNNIPPNVTVVAVSKTKPVKDIQVAYDTGHKVFGENKVQELVRKFEGLPKDIEWHFIGHLQTNKVKYIVPFVHLLHGIDSLKLLKEVNKEAFKNNKVQDCLLQVRIASEESKYGLSEIELINILSHTEFKDLKNIRVTGLMGMATFTDQEEVIRSEFRNLSILFKRIKNEYFKGEVFFKDLSMGMSGDYPLAIEEGATIIRIGSNIFGERDYSKH